MRRLPVFYIAYRADSESGIAKVRQKSFSSAKRELCKSVENVQDAWQVNASLYRLATEGYLPESGWKHKNRVRK